MRSSLRPRAVTECADCFRASDDLIADSVRDISRWVESLIDSQINLICALLEAVSLGDAPGAVTRALIGI